MILLLTYYRNDIFNQSSGDRWVSAKLRDVSFNRNSLISGLVEAVSETLGGIEVIVPEYSQHIGAVGAALLVSGMGHRNDNK